MTKLRKLIRHIERPCVICGNPTRYKNKYYGWKCKKCKKTERGFE